MDESDLRHLERCLELAEEALAAGDEPFGSVLVSAAGEVLHEDRNRETTAGDPTAHPELALAQWAGQHLTREERAGATVFTSGEHCPMCAAAHAWVGLGRIVFASSSEQLTQWRDELSSARRRWHHSRSRTWRPASRWRDPRSSSRHWCATCTDAGRGAEGSGARAGLGAHRDALEGPTSRRQPAPRSSCPLTAASDHTVLEGEGRGGGTGADVELGEDVGEVAGDGLLAEDQLGGDLRVAAAGSDQAEDLGLACGETGGERGGGQEAVGVVGGRAGADLAERRSGGLELAAG